MPCIKNECALVNIFPKSNAGMACDINCYLDNDEAKDKRDKYKKEYPKEMGCYKNITRNYILNEIRNIILFDKNKREENKESYCNPYYLISECFDYKELEKMKEEELKIILKLSKFVSDVFY